MKNKLTTHANERYFQRANQDITRKRIINHIMNGGTIHYAKRMTATRSLAYIPIDNEIFKVIMSRKNRTIISILPFNDLFIRKIKVHSEYYNNKTYIIELYPDCYNETKSIHAFTKIYEIPDQAQRIEINYNHPFFEGLFKSAWKIHLAMKGLSKYEEANSENKIQTIELTTQFATAN